VMHIDEYVGGENIDMQVRIWNQFIRPKYAEELEISHRANPYVSAILVTEDMIEQFDRQRQRKQKKK
jgi:hypothetical protein